MHNTRKVAMTLSSMFVFLLVLQEQIVLEINKHQGIMQKHLESVFFKSEHTLPLLFCS
jgi:hypothetical protein